MIIKKRNRRAPLKGRPMDHDRPRLAERLHPRRQIHHVPLLKKRKAQGEIGRFGRFRRAPDQKPLHQERQYGLDPDPVSREAWRAHWPAYACE